MNLNAEVLLDEWAMDAVYEWREGLAVLREFAPDLCRQVEQDAASDAEWQAVCTMANWQAAFEPVTVRDALEWGLVLPPAGNVLDAEGLIELALIRASKEAK